MDFLKKVYEAMARRRGTIIALAAVVVFITTYVLILPAFTLEKDEATEQGGIDVPATEEIVDVGETSESFVEVASEVATEDTTEATNKEVASDESEIDTTLKDEPKEVALKKDTGSAINTGGNDAATDPLAFEGEGFNVSVNDTNSILPDNTSLNVRPIDPDLDKKEYKQLKKEALEAVREESGDKKASVGFAHFYDLTLQANGHDIEPKDTVSVKIEYDRDLQKELKIDDAENVRIVHFAVDSKTGEATPEVLDTKATEINTKRDKVTDATFDADSFSVYAVVYTVDFHYDVDGEKYDTSIHGGDCITLRQLVEAMKVIEDDSATEENEIDLLMDEVKTVKFSDSELIDVSKVDEDTTVGALKEARGLECVYSDDLDENDIASINARALKAGDWALVSLKPFNTDETLIVTMNNGDEFTIKVTDGQINGELTSGGKYLIYYTSGNYHYVLKNDGTYTRVATSNETQLDSLGDEYLWQFDNYEYYGEEYSLVHNGTTYLTLDGSGVGVISNAPVEVYIEPYDGGGFRVWGEEWVSTGWFTGYYLNHYLSFRNDIFGLTDNANSNTRIKLWEQKGRPYYFTVKTQYNNVYRGTVSGRDASNIQQNNEASFIGITNQDKTNKNTITATPGQGYRFKEWRLGDEVVSTNPTINAKGLTFPEDNMILTAVFEKIPNTPGFPDYSDLIDEWKEQNLNTKINMDKTAQVYDYDNRIYEVDLSASAAAKAITRDIQLAFVTDVSRSMYFPAELGSPITYHNTKAPGTVSGYNEAKDFVVKRLDYYRGQNWAQTHSADGDDVYYLIADPAGKSTVYAVRRDNVNNKWMYIDASYDVTRYPKKGATQTSQWEVYKDNGDKAGWKVLSEKITFSDGHLKLEGYDLDGNIYVAKDVRYRLDYLQQAVDIASDVVYAVNKDAEVGIVTFAGEANDPAGLFGKSEYGQLLTELNKISPEGGTNQKAGLDNAKQFWNTASDVNHERAVILITDGAPNPKTGSLDWSQIAASAGELKSQKSATVHTVGLSIDDVAGAGAGLEQTANRGGGTFSSAKNGRELVKSVLDIVSTYLKDVNYKGTLQDDVDPAFYPVDKNGEPIKPGYYDDNGNPLTQTQVIEYNEKGWAYSQWLINPTDNSWTVRWNNLAFGRGTNSSPTTHKKIYVKAREDFMGGNNISTNNEDAIAFATKFVDANNKEGPLDEIRESKAETPHVNVDELHFSSHKTEWTVYLGTDVKPEDQLKALWDNIEIKQVVKKGGTLPAQDEQPADVSMISGKDKMYYNHSNSVNGNDTAAPTQDENPANRACDKLPLSHYGLDGYYNDLLDAIKSGNNYASPEIPYNKYGHEAGHFKITAEKILDSHVTDAKNKAPGQHTTDYAVSPAETYKIMVQYIPKTTEVHAATAYEHTTPGGSAGKITNPQNNEDKSVSENRHVINVIKRGLTIKKVDPTSGTDRPLSGAKFGLYRKPLAGESEAAVSAIGAGSYYKVTTLTTNGSGLASLPSTLQELKLLAAGEHYYLVEETPPAGYKPLSSPVQFDLDVTPGTEAKPYEATENITNLINIGEVTSGQSTSGTNPIANISLSSTVANVVDLSDGNLGIRIINRSAGVDISIIKNNDKGQSIGGAVFKLVNGQQIVPVAASGDGVTVTAKTSGQTVTISDNTFTIPEGGVLIDNLPPSDQPYYIVEVAPPEGYVIIDDQPAHFKITAGDVTDVEKLDGVGYTSSDRTFTVPNEPGAELPNAGGIGTTIFYVLGSLLVLVCAVVLISRRRMRDN